MALTDNELIERILAGERHQYGPLIDRYREKAFALAVRTLHNREDAEEAVQDAFVRAYRSLSKFERRAKFSTWLFRIVYNVCMTRVLRDTNPEEVSYEEGVEQDLDMGAIALEHDVEVSDLIGFIKKTIDEMPEKYSSILTLFYLQDMTHDEVCEVTGLPLGTVKVHLHRARVMLKTALARELPLKNVTAAKGIAI